MAVQNEMFDIFVGRYGSGFEAVNLILTGWNEVNAGQDNKRMIVLTPEALSEVEFDGYVDELIAQLQAIKKKGHSEIRKIKRRDVIS